MARPKAMFGVPRGMPATRGFFGASVRSKEERKVIDTAAANYVFDTTGTITLISGVATGTDFTNRIGRKIIMKSVQLRGLVYPIDQTVADVLCRIMLVYDSQPNGAAPAMTDILAASDSTEFLNLNNRDRFRVLAEWMRPVAVVTNAATQSYAGSPTTHVVNLFRKLNHEVVFGGTAATIGSIQTGAVWLVTIGNVAANAGGSSQLTARIRFIDA